MSYQVGIDLGTTFTAAAVFRDGAATIFTLGTRSAAIPSVVLLRADGTVLIGDAAERRAMSEPERVVREFKRRLGDTTPIIVGGAPYSAEALTARLLESVIEQVSAREGGPPSRIVITHPANWGDYKRDLLQQAVRLAGVDIGIVELLTEPEAAALSYAAQERIDPGEVVAVYDLGGGTFDAAILRRTPDGFSVLGKPEGIERLGGIDFDAAVFAHVTSGLGTALAELDHDDPAALAAVARLRQDCIDAKEALSADTDASIPVLLPNLQTEVRITRQEFETIIRPSLLDSIEAMNRAVLTAGLGMSDVSRVLLVGGSSRIPLISLLVTSELGRPVAVDAHPKHAIALGAAFAASGILDSSPDAPTPSPEKDAASRGLDPNMTVVAPAHLYNPSAGQGGAQQVALPVERPRRSPATPAATPISPATPAAAPVSPAPATPAARRRLPVDRPVPVDPAQPAKKAPSRRDLPFETPSIGRPGSGRALPIETPKPGSPNPASPSSGRVQRALPVEKPPGGPPSGSAPSAPAAPSTPSAPSGPARALPVERPGPQPIPRPARRPPPAAPTPSFDDSSPTSLFRDSNEVGHTSIYQGPNPALGGREVGPAASPGPVDQRPNHKRSPALWYALGLVVIALIVAAVLLAPLLMS